MSTLTKVNSKVTATFDKSEAEKFITPLSDFQKVSGTSLSLRFNKDNTITIKAINDSKNIISYIDFIAGGLPNLKVTEECRVHIYELGEFVSLSKVFSSGFDFVFNDAEKYVELSSGDADQNQSVKFHPSDETVINKCPESLKTDKIPWFSSFAWDSKKYANFIKGMSSLAHPYVILEGKKGEKVLSLSVSESKIKTTTLKTNIKIEKENTDSFRVVVNKENFLNPVTSSVTSFRIDISQKLISFVGESPYHKVLYYVTSIVESAE
jgi:hypothetical protein